MNSDQKDERQSTNFLLVEDNPDHAELTMRIIRKANYANRIDVVEDGKEALDYLLNQGPFTDAVKYPLPGIILMDIDLPQMDGMTTVEHIKRYPHLEKIPIIGISSHTDTESRLRMLRSGAVDYIFKPFQPEELEARIGTHLKMKSMYEKMVRHEKLYTAGLMATGISHEIRNRLNSINMAMYFLKDKMPEDDDVKRSINGIENEIQRGVKLVNDMLKFSSPQKPYFEMMKVDQLVKSIVSMIEKKAEEHQVRIGLQGVVENLPRIEGDYSQLMQAISNIMINAIQSMPAGGDLNVSVELPEHAEVVNIVISDTGSGMDEHTLSHLFEPFFTTSDLGTGLGLAVSRSLISEHNGMIEVESTPGVGSTFTVRLPLQSNGNGSAD